MREKGFVLPLVLVVLVLVAAIVGAVAYFQLKPKPPETRPTQTVTETTPSQVPSQTPSQQTTQPPTQPTPTSTANQSQNPELPSTQSPPAQNSGISVSVFCIDKIYERPCGNVGGVIIKTADGTEVARQKSNESGQFKVFLNQGDYRVVPFPGTSQYPIINSEPRQVKVNQDQFTELKLSYWDGRR